MAEYDDLIYTHQKTGKMYRIVHFGVNEATLEPVVIYKGVTDGAIWVRTCANFFDGRFVTGGADAADGELSPEMKTSMEAATAFEVLVDERIRNGVWPRWMTDDQKHNAAVAAVRAKQGKMAGMSPEPHGEKPFPPHFPKQDPHA